jgi:predicted amidohydrolase
MNRVIVGLAQIYPKLGDIETNWAKHRQIIEQAAEQGVNLLVFPELSLTGYDLRDLVQEVAITTNHEIFRELKSLTLAKHIDVMIGFVDSNPRGGFHIAAAYVSQGEVVHVHHKIYLPTYGIFDEGRYFFPGQQIRAFKTAFGTVGMLICEDFWHVSPAYVLWMDGTDILLFHSASPGRGLNESHQLHSSYWVELVNRAYGSFFTNYVVHCNRVGYEDGLNFWGGSSIVDPNGDFMIHAPYFEETLMIQELDLNQLRRTRSRLPLLRDERLDLTLRELNRITHKFD